MYLSGLLSEDSVPSQDGKHLSKKETKILIQMNLVLLENKSDILTLNSQLEDISPVSLLPSQEGTFMNGALSEASVLPSVLSLVSAVRRCSVSSLATLRSLLG